MTTPLTPTKDSDLPGDAVSIELANRAATASWWAGVRVGLALGWATALAAAAVGAWGLG